MTPEGLDPLLAQVDEATLLEHFKRLQTAISRTVDGMPGHSAYLGHLVGLR